MKREFNRKIVIFFFFKKNLRPGYRPCLLVIILCQLLIPNKLHRLDAIGDRDRYDLI